MTTVSEEKREEREVLPDAEAGPLRRQARTRASSLTPDFSSSPGAVTGRVRRAGQAASRAVAVLDKPGTLVHSQPPTFRQAWDRHLECARHYEALALRWPRYWWGMVHLLIVKPALNLAEWLTESPARCLVALILSAAIWVFA